MDPSALQAVIGLVGVAVGGGLVNLLRLKSLNRRDEAQNRRDDAEADEHQQGSAKLLAEAYGLLVDDLRAGLTDAQEHVHRQDKEMQELRSQLAAVMTTKDQEIAAVRLELSTERTENGRLRDRVAELERKVLELVTRPAGARRQTDPPPAPA